MAAVALANRPILPFLNQSLTSFLRPTWSLPCTPSSSTPALPITIDAQELNSALEAGTQTGSWLALIPGMASLWELFPPILMAVPKSKISHSRKSMRSANKGLKNKTNFSNCEGCGMVKLTHNLCPNCYSQISRRWKQEAREGLSRQGGLGGVEVGGGNGLSLA